MRTRSREFLTSLVCMAALACDGAMPRADGGASSVAAVRVQSPAVVGDLRLETLVSRVFGNTRKLRVLVPDGYDAPENRARRYPVLYLADGQNLFDPATSVFGPSEWRVDETMQELVAAGTIPPMIVVGVDDAGRTGRAHEYLPHPDTGNAKVDPAYDPAPQGARYPEFMVDEVMPMINARYRTATGPASTSIGGSSWGALISAYVIATRPRIFGAALLESPTVGVYGWFILHDLAAARSLPERVYVGMGTNEDSQPGCDPHSADQAAFAHNPMLDGARRLEQTLKSAGLDSSRLKVVVEPCATHTHAVWARRLPAALTFLFRNR